MHQDEFAQLIQPFLDGELSAGDLARFEACVASAPWAKDALTFQQQLRQRVQVAANQPVAAASCARVMVGFRQAASRSGDVQAGDAGRVLSGEADATRRPSREGALTARGSERRRWIMMAIPAVAAAGLVGLWLGGYFPSRSWHTHTPLLEAVWEAGDRYYTAAGITAERPETDTQRIAAALSHGDSFLLWADPAVSTRAERLAECEPHIAAALGGKLNLAELLPANAELVAFNIVDLKLSSGGIRAPHFVFLLRGREVSAFVFDRRHAGEAFSTLHGPENLNEEAIGFHACPGCTIISRRIGEQIVVFISRMKYDDVKRLVLGD